MWVPGKPESLSFVANQLDLSVHLVQRARLELVLCAIKDQKLAIYTECGNNVRVLRLVAGFVDLSRMRNLVHDVAFDGCDVTSFAVTPNFASVLIVVFWVRCCSFGNLHIRDLQKVWALI